MHLLDVDARAIVRFLPGDLLAIFAFVFVGELQHSTLTLSQYNGDWLPFLVEWLDRYAAALLPFLIGWLVVAPLFGGYDSEVLASTRMALLMGATSWLGADLVGQLLRETKHFPGRTNPEFFFVALLFGGLFVLAARFGTLVVVDLTAE